MLVHVIGGVALLLWATRMVRTGFQRAYGADLRQIIRSGTRNRFLAFLAGLGVTGLVQSSTATAMMTASFASRELIAPAAALAVMLGADVGTSLVAQVLSLKIGFLSPVFILVGVIMFLSSKRTRWRDLGRVGIGLGLLLLAIKLIISASEPVRQSPTLQAVITALADEPILAVTIAALLTWLAHSSLAIVLLIMSMAATGAVPVGLAFVLVLGANLGGTIPPMMAASGETAMARRVPLGNCIMRAIGVVAAVPLVGLIAPYVTEFEADPARQVVDFHTLFNVALAVVFIGLIDPVAALCRRLLPRRPEAANPAEPRYLDNTMLEEPAVALAAAAREALRMGDVVESMLTKSGQVIRTNDRKLRRDVEDMDDIVDQLFEKLKLFLTAVSRAELDGELSDRCVQILNFATNLEHAGDIIDKNLMELAAKKIKNKLNFSEEGQEEIDVLYDRVLDHVRLSFSVFLDGDLDIARRLIREKSEFRDLERAAAENHHARLRSGQPETIETSSLHLDILRDLKRVHSHIAAVAYPILESAGELRSTRLRPVETEKLGISGQ